MVLILSQGKRKASSLLHMCLDWTGRAMIVYFVSFPTFTRISSRRGIHPLTSEAAARLELTEKPETKHMATRFDTN